MVAWSSRNCRILNGLAIENYLADTTLFAVGILDGDIERSIAQDTVYGIFFQRRGDTGVNLDTVVGRLNAKNILRDGYPVSGGGTRKP